MLCFHYSALKKQMNKILLTGADGFIGSHLTEALVRKGYKVRAFVLYNSFNSWGWLDKCGPEVKGKFEVFSGDIRDPHGVKEAMKGCDVVLHLAALIAIPYSYHSPDTYVDTNIKGTLNVLQAARELGVRRIVHTSTSEVYGTARFVPITEEHPLQGQSPYSASKIGADQLAFSFYASFKLPVVIARPFNTYGPRPSTGMTGRVSPSRAYSTDGYGVKRRGVPLSSCGPAVCLVLLRLPIALWPESEPSLWD